VLISERVKEDNEARLKAACYCHFNAFLSDRSIFYLTDRMRFIVICTFIDNEYLRSQWSNFDHCDDGYSLSMTIQTALNHIPHFDFINKTAINGFLIYSFSITSGIFLITLIL